MNTTGEITVTEAYKRQPFNRGYTYWMNTALLGEVQVIEIRLNSTYAGPFLIVHAAGEGPYVQGSQKLTWRLI